uniref:Acyl-coenzyme A thioesterase 13 n=1 Tax=Acrobeloides nanus TaxID=290746 RepID=A0A914DQI0_9BILA
MTSKYLSPIKQVFKAYQTSSNFMKIAGNCRVISADEGRVKVEFEVTESVTNPMNTLHGGATATLVDIVTTTALMATERGEPGVSVDLTVSYLAPAKLNSTVVFDASVLRMGKTLAYTKCDLFSKEDNKLLATGLHTKAFPTRK